MQNQAETPQIYDSFEGFYVALHVTRVTLYRSYHDGCFFVCRGNQYIQLVSRFCTVNCLPSVSNCQLSHIRFGGLNHRPQRWEASVLLLCPPAKYLSHVACTTFLYIKQLLKCVGKTKRDLFIHSWSELSMIRGSWGINKDITTPTLHFGKDQNHILNIK